MEYYSAIKNNEFLIAPSASKKKLETAYTSNIIAHLKALEQQQNKQKTAIIPKSSRWQEIIILTAEINQVERKQTLQSSKPGADFVKKQQDR